MSRNQNALPAVLLWMAAVWVGIPLETTAAPRTATRPNILFIAVDDLRPELGCSGKDYIKSPNIDRIAKAGMVFERAYCQQAVCSPSRSSLMTARGRTRRRCGIW